MNDDHENNLDEERLAKMLASARHDAAPPDAEFLRRLREQSTAAFMTANRPTIQPISDRRYRMWTVRGLIAALAASALLMVYHWGPSGSNGTSRAFADVVERTISAQSVRYRVLYEGFEEGRSFTRSSLLSVRGPDRAHWEEEGSAAHIIHRGDRTWWLRESANSAYSTERTSDFGGKYPVDLSNLMHKSLIGGWQQFLRQHPVERRHVGGQPVDV